MCIRLVLLAVARKHTRTRVQLFGSYLINLYMTSFIQNCTMKLYDKLFVRDQEFRDKNASCVKTKAQTN